METVTLQPPLPTGVTRAMFCVGRQRIFADVFTGERRLIDMLRDPGRHYLDVRNARLADPARVEQRFFAHVRKSTVRVAFVLPSGEIEATVHVENASTDPVQFFLR